MKDDKFKLIKAGDVARLLNISPKTVYAMAQRGELPAIKLGRRTVRFDRQEIMQWLNQKKEDRNVGSSPGE